jgi:UDP-glucose 4-epimerase
MTSDIKTFLVTGGAGFVGHTVTKKLLEDGHKVIVLDNLSKGKREYLPESLRLSVYIDDICNEQIYDRITAEHPHIDGVIHLAAKHFIPDCNSNYKQTIETNVAGTAKIIQWANDTNIQKIIFASSAAVYGSNYNNPIQESDDTNPQDIYGHSKLLAENILKLYKGQTIILRLFNIFGPNETNDHLLPKIINQVQNSDSIKIGNLAPKRDYIYVDDVCNAILCSLNYTKSDTFNIGSGTASSVEDVVKKIQSIAGKNLEIVQSPQFQRKNDIPYLCADIAHAKKILDWRPLHSLDSGLKMIL